MDLIFVHSASLWSEHCLCGTPTEKGEAEEALERWVEELGLSVFAVQLQQMPAVHRDEFCARTDAQ